MLERRNGRTNNELARMGLKECPICHCCWTLSGLTRHYNSCKKKAAHRQKALDSIRQQGTILNSPPGPSRNPQHGHSQVIYTGSAPLLQPADGTLSQDHENDRANTFGGNHKYMA